MPAQSLLEFTAVQLIDHGDTKVEVNHAKSITNWTVGGHHIFDENIIKALVKKSNDPIPCGEGVNGNWETIVL